MKRRFVVLFIAAFWTTCISIGCGSGSGDKKNSSGSSDDAGADAEGNGGKFTPDEDGGWIYTEGGFPTNDSGGDKDSATTNPGICGNGDLEGDEQCDDGNTKDGDGCDRNCTMEEGYSCPVPGEKCKKCGNGILEVTEVCDDGNTTAGDGCSLDCTAVEPGFKCDNAGEACITTCGDGVVAGSEVCDDHNKNGGDGCSADCSAVEAGWVCPNHGLPCQAAECGDHIIAGSEQCDDDDNPPTSGDGCDDQCRLEPSPDLEHGWNCDTPGEACTLTDCGNGTREGSEQCDDGNNDTGDGCSPWCALEPDCSSQHGCASNAGCVSSCGDDLKLAPEECDDGNVLDGDGCSSNCEIEDGFDCQDIGESNPAQIVLPIIYRDFRGYTDTSGSKHPDFENPFGEMGGDDRGIVTNCLGDDGLPVYANASGGTTTTTSTANFNQWYRDATNVNLTFLDQITLDRQTGGEYRFTRTGNNMFFPLDGMGWGNQQGRDADNVSHNFHFTSVARYWFEYRGGEELDFSGDDDVWVYVNGHRVIDLGGVHEEETASITLDATAATANGLQTGKVYEIVVFQAERHTVDSNYTLTISDFQRTYSECHYVCGDGIVTQYEICDDGKNDGSYGSCTADCLGVGPYCGDAIKNGPEECDDGKNDGSYGTCTPSCKLSPYCGDGATNGPEKCDDGEDNGEYNKCKTDCSGIGPHCGDGKVNGPEQCDDGENNGEYNKCKTDCTGLGPHCGDGKVNGPEQCDDGNNTDKDGCSAKCHDETR